MRHGSAGGSRTGGHPDGVAMDLSGKKIHFMGIGGVGMSALAEMAKRSGAIVSGCDRAAGSATAKLERRGIPVAIGHDAAHAGDVDLLIYTSAVPADHPERLAAVGRQEKRGAFLARFMNETEAWGISGTHGKTTTTWLLSHILIEAGRDPTVFIGGMADGLPDGNFRLGSGPFIAELDESDASFLLPRLALAVITNIESDHLSHYHDDAALLRAFGAYAEGVADDGLLIAGVDKPFARDVYRNHRGRKLSFGINEPADISAIPVNTAPGEGMVFDVEYRGRGLGAFAIALPGLHNVENALAALGAALEMGVDVELARAALATASGVGRRLERLGTLSGAVLYSDYAHHPTEVAASIDALRRRHGGGIMVVFQPHLYTRTRDYADAFGMALARADRALIADIYPARELPIPGITADLLVARTRENGGRAEGPFALARIGERATQLADGYEAVVMMGAGDIDDAARKLITGEGDS